VSVVGRSAASCAWRAVWATSLVGAGRAEESYRESAAVLEKARACYPTRGSNLLPGQRLRHDVVGIAADVPAAPTQCGHV
jgi:hypothetical protein